MPRDGALATLAARDYQTYVETFADTPGVTVTTAGGVRVRRSAIDDDYLNGVFGAVLRADTVDTTIGTTIDEFRRDGQAFHWMVWPDDRPSDLVERLEAAGLEQLDTIPLMTLDLAGLGAPEATPAGLVVREATDPAEQRAVAAFAVRAVGWDAPEPPTPFAATFLRLAAERPPRWRLFGGWLDDELVTTAALFTGSGMAGIYAVLTADAMRGRGYGRVVTKAALHAGREDGRTTGVLMASDLGLPVYRRIGFEVVGDVQVLRWPGPSTIWPQRFARAWRGVDMSRYAAPPGDTFEERWPDEAAETRWLAAPWLPIILGGFAGLFGAPLFLLSLFGTWSPESWIVGAAVLGLLTLGVLRTSGSPARLLGRLWRIAAFVALSLALGFAMWLVGSALCETATCAVTFGPDASRFAISAMMFAATVLGSILIAMWVDRGGRWLAARARATGAP